MAGRKDKSKAKALPKLNLEEEAAKTPNSVMEKAKKVRTELAWGECSTPTTELRFNFKLVPFFSLLTVTG